MKAVDKLLAVALAEEGYLEKKSPSQLDDKTANAGAGNYTKYARDLDKTDIFNGPKQGYDWCATYVVWTHVAAFGVEAARKILYLPVKSCAAGVDWLVRYFKAAGAFVSEPVIGGPIFFTNAKGQWQHVETVYDYRDGIVYTIGGNTAGERVAQKSYSVNDKSIGGYGRPDWSQAPEDDIEDIEEEENMPRYNTMDEIKKGAPWACETVQKLIDRGIIVGGGVKDAENRPADMDLSHDMLRLMCFLDRAGVFDR